MTESHRPLADQLRSLLDAGRVVDVDEIVGETPRPNVPSSRRRRGLLAAAGPAAALGPVPAADRHRPRPFGRVVLRSAIAVVAVATVATVAITVSYRPTPRPAPASGGRHWSSSAMPSQEGEVQESGITCPSPEDCLVAGWPSGYLTTDGGQTWSDTSARVEDAVSCPTTRRCEAVGTTGALSTFPESDAYVSTDGGRTWHAQAIPAKGVTLEDVACPSASACDVLGRVRQTEGDVVLRTTDGGVSWTRLPLPTQVGRTSNGATEIICLSTFVCEVEAGRQLLWTTDGGTSWSVTASPDGSTIHAMTCSSDSTCVAVGSVASDTGAAYFTDDDGSSWGAGDVPAGVSTLLGVSCATASACTAVGDSVLGAPLALSSLDGGRTWREEQLAPPSFQLMSVDCVTGETCEIGGSWAPLLTALPQPMAWPPPGATDRTTDGGQTWTLAGAPPGLGQMACPTANVCISLAPESIGTGWLLDRTVDGGQSWTVGRSPLADPGDGARSCPSASVCLLVGGSLVARSEDGGSSWRVKRESFRDATAIACPTVSDCVVLASAGAYRTTDGGATWTHAALPGRDSTNLSLACPTTTWCIASRSENDPSGPGGPYPSVLVTTSDGGRSWTKLRTPSAMVGSPELSCWAAGDCVLAGANSPASVVLVTHDGGAHWTNDALGGGWLNVRSVSCTEELCMAIVTSYQRQGILRLALGDSKL
jgi:photosystem II stability/assembly factor-like uncharacterized protein